MTGFIPIKQNGTKSIVDCNGMSTLINVIVSSPEPKAHGELIVYQSSRRVSVCLSVCSHFQT